MFGQLLVALRTSIRYDEAYLYPDERAEVVARRVNAFYRKCRSGRALLKDLCVTKIAGCKGHVVAYPSDPDAEIPWRTAEGQNCGIIVTLTKRDARMGSTQTLAEQCLRRLTVLLYLALGDKSQALSGLPLAGLPPAWSKGIEEWVDGFPDQIPAPAVPRLREAAERLYQARHGLLAGVPFGH